MTSFNSDWVRRRWLDFRNGHSIYLVFAMTFANFITIQYQLLIDKLPYWAGIFNSIGFLRYCYPAYVPVSIVLGYGTGKVMESRTRCLFRENKLEL